MDKAWSNLAVCVMSVDLNKDERAMVLRELYSNNFIFEEPLPSLVLSSYVGEVG